MREEYKHSHCDVMGSLDSGQGRYVCQNTQLATRISVIHRLVQKYETLPVLPKKLTETETQEMISRRGVLSLDSVTRF
jgi:hypothetical protein